jgi:prolyl-tRNA synthetase
MAVNETKLANAVKASELRPAREEEIRAIGAEPGYGSPVGARDALVVVDDLAAESPNLVAGANEAGYHLLNVNHGRDYRADLVVDITSAQEGDACVECGGPLRPVGGVEVGNIFKLGTRYSADMGCAYLDRDGETQMVVMGSYGIGTTRLLACIAEEHRDERGLVWPVAVAPYEVHLVSLASEGAQGEEARKAAEGLYAGLQSAGVEVLSDDRDATPGVKFNDADLIGLPLRVTVSARSLRNGGVEVKRRDRGELEVVAPGEALQQIRERLKELWSTQTGT